MKKLFHCLTLFCSMMILSGCWLFGDLDSTLPATEFYFATFEELKSNLNTNNILFPEHDLTEEEIEKKGNYHLFHHYLMVDLTEASAKIIDTCYRINVYQNNLSLNDIQDGAPLLAFYYKVDSEDGLRGIVIELKPCSESLTKSFESKEWEPIPTKGAEWFHTPFGLGKCSPDYLPKEFVNDLVDTPMLAKQYVLHNMIITFIYESSHTVTDEEIEFEENIFNYASEHIGVFKIE